MDNISCSFCPLKVHDSKALKEHFKVAHCINTSEKRSDGFLCKTDQCTKSFKRFRNLANHIDKYHYIPEQHKTSNVQASNTSSKPPETSNPLSFDGHISELIANLRFSTNITGSDMGRFVTSAENLLSNVMTEVSDKVKDFLKLKNIDTSNDETKTFLEQFKFNESFKQYKTIKGQIKALKNKYYFIEAEEVNIDTRTYERFNKETQQNETVIEQVNFQYVPVTETLKLILSNKEVMDYIKSEKKITEEDLLCSYEDGENYKDHPLFKKFSDALGLHLYYDEFLVNNPLGSKTRTQKIGAFYFSLANLPPHLHNFLGNVHVLGFGLEKDIKEYGINRFLTPFVLELVKLERDSGVPVKINNEDFILRATLLTVCADTLAAHEVLGFIGPSANYYCRLCTTTSTERKYCPPTEAPLRSKELHEQHVKDVEDDPTATSLTGVKHNSILNDLKYFHCTTNYVFDIMHDILEGQAQFDLKLVIARLTTNKSYDLNVNTLNDRITRFQYGPSEIKNKPSPTLSASSIRNVSSDHKLQERAVQTWCLLRIFPFLIADKVLSDDPYLQYIINMNKIIEMVFAPKLKLSILPHLDELICQHGEQFSELFPEQNAINKGHHMRHYALCIQKSGPLRHLACFKYEANHLRYKKYGSICCNFKNITKSMSNISQMSQCAVWGTNKATIRQKIQTSVVEDDTGNNSLNIKVFEEAGVHVKGSITLVNQVEVYGIHYEKNSFVAIESGVNSDENMPIFGKINDIFINEDQVYLYCKEFVSESLSEHLNAYKVIEGSEFRLVNTEMLCDPKPYSLWNAFSSDLNYICLRHILI